VCDIGSRKDYVQLLAKYVKQVDFFKKDYDFGNDMLDAYVFADVVGRQLIKQGSMSELMQAMRHTEVVKASVKFQGFRSGNGIVALKPSRKGHGPGVPQKKVSVQEMIDEIREKFQITDEEALFIREVTEQKLQDPDVKDAVARNRDDDEYLFGPYRQQVHVQISDIYQESGHYEEIADDKYSGNGGIFDSMATVVIQTIRAA
jgi:type I restriction enzyme R subunit